MGAPPRGSSATACLDASSRALQLECEPAEMHSCSTAVLQARRRPTMDGRFALARSSRRLRRRGLARSGRRAGRGEFRPRDSFAVVRYATRERRR